MHGTYKRCLDSIQRRPGSSLQRGQEGESSGQSSVNESTASLHGCPTFAIPVEISQQENNSAAEIYLSAIDQLQADTFGVSRVPKSSKSVKNLG